MALFKNTELEHLWIFYLAMFIHAFSAMVMPFLVVYFLGIGFTFFQTSLFLASYSLTIFLFEVPTGAVADGFSRKYSVLIGLLITSVVMFILPFLHSFWPLFFLWSIAGFGATFISGAGDAWVVDNLTFVKKNALIHEYYIKSQSISGVAIVFAPLIAVLVVKHFTIRPLWFVFAGGLFLVFLLYSFAPEHYKPKKVSLKRSFQHTITISKQGAKHLFSKRVLVLLLLGSIAFSFMRFASEAWEPFLVQLGLPTYTLGYLFSLFGLVLVGIPFLSRYFAKFSVRSVLLVTTFFEAILLSLLFFIASPLVIPGIIIYLLIDVGGTIRLPLRSAFMQEFIPKKIRATVGSVQSMILSLVGVITGLFAGFLIDLLGMQFVIAVQGIFGVAVLLIYRLLPDKKIKQ